VSFQIFELLNNLIRIDFFLDSSEALNSKRKKSFRKTNPQLNSPIIFKNVSLTSGLQPLLKKVNFRIENRSRACLFSVEGGGRSNIFELLTLGLERDHQDKSSIVLFGTPVEELDAAVIKEKFFMIERRPLLFEGTIRDNIDPVGIFSLDDIYRVMRVLSVNHVLPGFRLRNSKASPSPTFSMAVRRKVSCFEQLPSSINRPEIGENLSQQYSRNYSSPTQSKLINFSQQSPLISSQIQKVLLPSDLCLNENPDTKPENPFKISARPSPDLNLGPNGSKSSGLESIQSPINRFSLLSNTLFIPSINNLLKDNLPINQKSNKLKPLASDTQNPELAPTGSSQSPSKFFEPSKEDSKKEIKVIKMPVIHFKNKFFEKREKTQQNPPQMKIDIPVIEQEFVEEEEEEPNLSRGTLEDRKEKRSDGKKLHRKPSRIGSFRSSLSKSKKRNSRQKILSKDIIENSPYKQKNLTQTQDHLDDDDDDDDDELVDDEVSDEILNNFLEIKANFEGKNLSVELKRFILFCRCLLNKPQLLLTFEESLQFGRGVEQNLEVIANHLSDSTIITVTKGHMNLLAYNTLIFLDSGKVIEKGNPSQLLKNEQSYLFRFLNETDENGLEYLVSKLQEIETEGELGMIDKQRKETISAFSAGKVPESQIAGDKNFSLNMQKCDLFNADFKSEIHQNTDSRYKYRMSDNLDSIDSRSKRSFLNENNASKNKLLSQNPPNQAAIEIDLAEQKNSIRISNYKSSIMKRTCSNSNSKQAQQKLLFEKAV